MTANTMAFPLNMTSNTMASTDLTIVNGVRTTESQHHEEDDRSSSLSELGERAGHDGAEVAFSDGSDVNDTEAETERLEDSPQKMRKHQNVVMTSTDKLFEDRPNLLATSVLPMIIANNGPPSDIDRMEQTSEMSSLAGSGDETARQTLASPSAARKRKRSSFEQNGIGDQSLFAQSPVKTTKTSRNTPAGTLVANPSLSKSPEEETFEFVVDAESLSRDRRRSQQSPETALPQQRYQKGKRKGRNTSDDEPRNEDNRLVSAFGRAKQDEVQQAVYSNGEDCENEDIGDVTGVDSAVKSEEAVFQKTSALNSLNTMERFFATFRDKLFDERLSQCNSELAMLESASIIHPELLAMKDVVDQRRDQKVKYEQNLLKYKLQTLQRESIANKAQAHSQYMQTAREIRDSSLEKLNRDFYQLQRERRSVDGDVPDCLYEFPRRRSEQVTHQTAYNAEVSILSGFAKYVGFPAAPDVSSAKPKEIEDDLQSMGISTHIQPVLQNHHPLLRAMSSTSNFSRQRVAADEHFLEQNPWANPQHPSHHQQRQLHRQVSGLSRASTPSSTSAAQRRVVDVTEPRGSASTIPEHPSGPNSSMAATPATGEAVRRGYHNQTTYKANNHIQDSTPSRITGASVEATSANAAPFEVPKDRNKGLQPSKLDQRHSPSLPQNSPQDSQMPKPLPKPLPFLHSGSGASSTPGPRTSTPGRYPIVKAEDQGHILRHSPLPQYHTKTATPLANGQTNKLAS